MIVNSKYFKNQWPDFSTFGITAQFRATSPNPRRTLYTLTALQFWLQLFTILLLANSVLCQWYFERITSTDDRWNGFVKFNLNVSMIFQLSDIIVSMYASFHLRNATSLYNNIQDVRIWIVINNLYVLSSLTCFIFFSTNIGSIEICIKAITVCLFACYKVYIVYQIYKDEKSAYLFLEQHPSAPFNDSSKSSDDGDQPFFDETAGQVIVEIVTKAEEREKF